MAGIGDLSAEFNIDDEQIINEAARLLQEQKSLQSESIEELKKEEQRASEEVFEDVEQKSLESFEKRKKELEELYRLNEESFRKKATDEDRYEFNKIVIQSKIDEINREVEQKRKDLGIETVEEVAGKKVEAEEEILSKRSEAEKIAGGRALQDFLKANQLDFEDRKEKLHKISEETYRAYREGKIQEREYERNTAIVNKQLRDLERREEESYSAETWKKVSGMEQKAKGIFGNLARIFGIGITGFGIYELISHLKTAVEEINVVNRGIQQIAARGGKTIEDLGAVVRQQLYGEIKDIREWTLLPLQEITSLMSRLRAGGRIEIENVGTIAAEVILESLKTGMDRLRIAELYNEMALKLDIPTSRLTSAFDGLYETAMNLKRPMEDHIRDVMAVSQGLRRYGFGLGTAQGIVAEFSEELEKGILATQDLINVQIMQRRMTEGRRAFAAMKFMDMPEEEAERLGVGAVQKYLRDVREREGILGVSTAVRLLAEGLPAGAREREERFERFGPLYERAAREGGELPIADIVKAELAARGYREEDRPLEYRRMQEMLTEAISGLTVADKMWEAGEKMLEAAGKQERSVGVFGTSVTDIKSEHEDLKAILRSQQTLWERARERVKNTFMDIASDLERVFYELLSLIPGVDVGYRARAGAILRGTQREVTGEAVGIALDTFTQLARERLREAGVPEPTTGYTLKEIEKGIEKITPGEALESFLAAYMRKIPEIPEKGEPYEEFEERRTEYLSDMNEVVKSFLELKEFFKARMTGEEQERYEELLRRVVTEAKYGEKPLVDLKALVTGETWEERREEWLEGVLNLISGDQRRRVIEAERGAETVKEEVRKEKEVEGTKEEIRRTSDVEIRRETEQKEKIERVREIPEEKPLSKKIEDGETLTAIEVSLSPSSFAPLITSMEETLSGFLDESFARAEGRGRGVVDISPERRISPSPLMKEGVRVDDLFPREALASTNIESINVDLSLTIPEKEAGDYVTSEDLEDLRREINEEIVKSKRFDRG